MDAKTPRGGPTIAIPVALNVRSPNPDYTCFVIGQVFKRVGNLPVAHALPIGDGDEKLLAESWGARYR
ncbi:hypothetical protein GCM10011572_35020 [Pseudoduganella buxea]|uniref:Uncharacterized protein n=1 Tax=Pseudoduganella buxea TaxID=1949069 RepID=A0ABQ1KWB3_9BURK|nr:hypothetical protein GCM10011572_35020 [Pseudoduganella buxea]